MFRKLQLLIATSFLGIFGLVFAPQIFAAVRCETQYGGGQVCVRTAELQIDKEVFNPQENKFVDNLGITSHKFAPSQEIRFKLIIKNVGDANFSRVTVTDTLPSLLELTAGQLSFELTDLGPGQSQEREFTTRVVSGDRFPSGQNTVCITNVAEARADSQHDRDTAQVCLERPGVGPAPTVPPTKKELPPTGPENAILLLFGSLLAGGAGVYFIRANRA